MNTSTRIGILILVTLFLVALWAGLLRKVTVTEETPQAWNGVYALHQGSFYGIKDSIADVENFVSSKEISPDKTFAIYFQDPNITPDELLVSWAGASTGAESLAVEVPYYNYTFESKNYVHTQFIGLPFMGAIRVYPKLKSYLKLHQYSQEVPIIETYTPGSYGQMIIDYYVEARKN